MTSHDTSLLPCPCRILDNVTLSYTDCCQPLHQQKKSANNAEQLMRSRYTAFVLVLPEYIVATTLPDQQSLLDKQAIELWATETDWAGLEVVNHVPKVNKCHSQVEFKAFYNTDEGRGAHHELSTFVKSGTNGEQAKWYFLDPTVALQVTQKQPCICGSGIKFKRCCGQFLTGTN